MVGMKWKRSALAVLALLSPAVGAAGAGLPAGRPAPLFAAPRLDGGTLSLQALRGRPVLLNFWSPTCPPCALEMPELEKLHRRYATRGLTIVGIVEMESSADEARRFVEERGVTYPIVLDLDGAIGARYRLEAHPTSVLLDARGTVRFENLGFLRGEEKEIEAAIQKVLGPASKGRAPGKDTGR
jgi:peroxiredoxin